MSFFKKSHLTCVTIFTIMYNSCHYVCSEASKYLVDVLLPISEAEQEDWLDRIIDIIQKQPCKID